MGDQQFILKNVGDRYDWLSVVSHGVEPDILMRRHPELSMVSYLPPAKPSSL